MKSIEYRGINIDYTEELAEDLFAIHGLKFDDLFKRLVDEYLDIGKDTIKLSGAIAFISIKENDASILIRITNKDLFT